MSGNEVLRADSRNATLYLKIAPRPNDPELEAEQKRLEWLQNKLPVPEVVDYYSDDTHTYMLITEVSGFMACEPQFAQNIPALACALAEGMQLIHSLDIHDCPFDQTATTQIARAQSRMHAGLVDETDFDERFQYMSATDVFAFLTANKPLTEDIVFTHGDYCLPNVLLHPKTHAISGFIDLSRAGTADRYQDIALATRSLAHNFGPGHHQTLWSAYGLDKPVHEKLSFYLALDEFF